MKRIVVWFWVLVVVLVARTQNNDEVDVKTFLENIKKMFQETVEKMKKQQENRMKRREDKKNKMRTREMLINKLANPYLSFRRQHTVIDYKKRPDTQSNRNNPQEKNNKADGKSEGISNQTINKVLKSNPVFNPFSIDRLNKLLSQIRKQPNNNGEQSTGNNNSSSTPSVVDSTGYENELKKWFREVYSKIDWFWDMIYRLFIVDEGRFKYLEEVLCKGEIADLSRLDYSSVTGCSDNNLPERFRVIKLLKSNNMPCESLVPKKLEVYTQWLHEVVTCVNSVFVSVAIRGNGQCTPSLYQMARFIGDKGRPSVKAGGIRPVYNNLKSLCYNLIALNLFALKNELHDILSFSNRSPIKEENIISYISSNARKFISYIQFMEKIFKGKIIPAVVDMCYGRCLCGDIGISCTKQQRKLSEEGTIIIVLWNFQKDVYLYSIDSLPKLVSFKDKLLENDSMSGICPSIYGDFKKIMGNIRKDIVEKSDKLNKMKKKIEDMEREGKVDTSVYEETIKLVEEVRKELIPVREELIKLWQNRIGSATSFDDLICVLDSFKKLIKDISIGNKNILELYLSDLSSGDSAKAKGLSRFISMVGGSDTLYVSFQYNVWNIGDLFGWVSALDYSIYVLTATFNALRCVIDSVPIEKLIEEFLDYLVSQWKINSDDAPFLKCFMSGVKTIKQCAGEKYGVIETIIGDVTIDSLGNLKDRIENLKEKYKDKKWGDIPAINDCCAGECINVSGLDWCWALTSPLFGECCNQVVGLRKCCDTKKQPGCNLSEPFCLSNDPDKVKCNSDPPHLSTPTSLSIPGSPCRSLSNNLISLFSISYNGKERRIFCDVIDKDRYTNFCEGPVQFINNIRDRNGNVVMESPPNKALKCKCLKCGLVAQNICRRSLSVNYTARNNMEGFLIRIGLLEEAKKAIEGGLSKNLGQCPF